MSDLVPLKRTLLALLGGLPGRVQVWPDAAGWEALDAMAAQHRLRPLLLSQARAAGNWPLPPEVLSRWEGANRDSALSSLRHKAALGDLAQFLGDAGLEFLALKGARLAWRDYPAPGLRPLRDIDLLVPESDVERAFAVLEAAGLVMNGGDEAAQAEALEHDKHLPPLWHARREVTVELHHRLTDPPARHGYHMPQIDPAAVIARAEPGEGGILFPAPDDMLAHLIIHALYNHRLDCGPLVLADLHFLIRTGGIDWARFWQGAAAQQWTRGAVLLLNLTERHFGPHGAPLPAGETAPPAEVIAAAEEALLQDFDTRDHAEAVADILAARSAGALFATLAGRFRPSRQARAQEEAAGASGSWLGWLGRRLGRLWGRLGNARANREAAKAAAMLRWIQTRDN
jgi:hypothetical protein